MITKNEIKYIAYSTIFAFIVFALVIPNILGRVSNLSPFVQFIIFNLGIFFFLQIFLSSVIQDRKHSLKASFGLIFLFLGLDLLIPPLLVSANGILNNTVILGSSATDYVVGYLLSNIGIKGFVLYLMVYVLAPMVLFIISAFLIKDFVKKL